MHMYVYVCTCIYIHSVQRALVKSEDGSSQWKRAWDQEKNKDNRDGVRYVYIYICMYVYVYIYMHTYVPVYAYECVCVCVYVFARM